MLINPSTLLAPKFDKMAVFGTNLMIQYSQLMIWWCVMTGQLIKTAKNTVCQVALGLGNHQNTQACHYLKTNLNTLQSGGVIYEIGENGQQTKLTPDLIQQKIHHIQAAIDSHCRN